MNEQERKLFDLLCEAHGKLEEINGLIDNKDLEALEQLYDTISSKILFELESKEPKEDPERFLDI